VRFIRWLAAGVFQSTQYCVFDKLNSQRKFFLIPSIVQPICAVLIPTK